MKQGRFSEEQIIGILKQNEAGAPLTQLCREHGIGESTFYKWNAAQGAPGMAALEDVLSKKW
jgi:putative transposase